MILFYVKNSVKILYILLQNSFENTHGWVNDYSPFKNTNQSKPQECKINIKQHWGAHFTIK